MKNILAIIKHDQKKIFSSVVAIIIAMGLILVPLAYAWMNIFSNWAPYEPEATGRIPVAVFSEDAGTDVLGIDLVLGDKIVDALQANEDIGWVFEDSYEKAIEGVRSGKYYAAIIIPEDFSTNAMSFANGSFKNPSLHYYENVKKNAIAPKILGKAKTAVEQQINATFIETIVRYVSAAASVLDANGYDPGTVFTGLGNRLTDLGEKLENYEVALASTQSLAASAGSLIEASENLVSSAGKTVGGVGDIVSTATSDLEKTILDTRAALDTTINIFNEIEGDIGGISNLLSSYGNALGSLEEGIEGTNESIAFIQSATITLSEIFKRIGANETINNVTDILANDNVSVAEYLASPIKMDTKVFYETENYGSGMAAFYTVLAQGIGSLFTAIIIKTRIKKPEQFKNLKLHEHYFGRYGTFLIIGLIQGFGVAIGDLLYVGIQCLHPWLFMLQALMNGIVFMMINYALVFSFENAGLAVGIFLLLLQVAGGGGTYPVEVMPPIFQKIYPFMPFGYAMDAMRECISGRYGNTYWHCMGVLALFFLGAAVLGMLLHIPARFLNNLIAKSKSKSGLMA